MSSDIVTFILNLSELLSALGIYDFISLFILGNSCLFLFSCCFCSTFCPLRFCNDKYKSITLFHQCYFSYPFTYFSSFLLFMPQNIFSASSSSDCLISSVDYGSTHLLNFEFQLLHLLDLKILLDYFHS